MQYNFSFSYFLIWSACLGCHAIHCLQNQHKWKLMNAHLNLHRRNEKRAKKSTWKMVWRKATVASWPQLKRINCHAPIVALKAKNGQMDLPTTNMDSVKRYILNVIVVRTFITHTISHMIPDQSTPKLQMNHLRYNQTCTKKHTLLCAMQQHFIIFYFSAFSYMSGEASESLQNKLDFFLAETSFYR